MGLPSVGGFGYLTVCPLPTNYGASHTQKGLIINGGFTDTDTDTDTGRKCMMSPYNFPFIHYLKYGTSLSWYPPVSSIVCKPVVFASYYSPIRCIKPPISMCSRPICRP